MRYVNISVTKTSFNMSRNPSITLGSGGFHDKEHMYFYWYYERNPSLRLSSLADLKFQASGALLWNILLHLHLRRKWYSFWLGFTPGVPFFGWLIGSLSIFDFFDRHHFFFHVSFVPPSFGPDFDDPGFMAFTSLLRSLPFNLHLLPVCRFHEVQFGIEDLLF